MGRSHYTAASVFAVLLSSGILWACSSGAPAGAPDEGAFGPTSSDTAQPRRAGRPSLAFSAGRAATLGAVVLRESSFGDDAGDTDAGASDAGSDAGISAAVETNATTYAYGDPITVTFSGMSGDPDDWIGIAPEGSPATSYAWYAYTDGALSGSITTAAGDLLPPGTWVARVFYANGYQIKSESAPFTIGEMAPLSATVTTDTNVYGGFDKITATFSGLSGSSDVFVTVDPPYGSTGIHYQTVNAGAVASGSVEIDPPLAGTWEVRVFEGTTWVGKSATFTVNAAVKTDATSYTVGDPIAVDFAAMQGLSTGDAIAISLAGSADDQYEARQTVDWYWSGTRTFDSSTLTPGTYVARAFFDFDTHAKAESAEFTVVAPQ